MAMPMLFLPWARRCGGVSRDRLRRRRRRSGALLMLWRQAPARRGMVLRRHSQSKLLALGEHWLSLLWAATDAIAAFGNRRHRPAVAGLADFMAHSPTGAARLTAPRVATA